MHHSILTSGEQIPTDRCKSCCSLYHCPLCPSYKATKLYRLKKHLDVHNKNSISFEDKKICRCHLECRNSGHFHCPWCPKTILKRSDMAKHLEACQKTFLITSTLAPETSISNLVSTPVPMTFSPQKTVSALQVISPPPINDHEYIAMSTVIPAALKEQHTLPKIKKVICPNCRLVCDKKNIPQRIQRKHMHHSILTSGEQIPTNRCNRCCSLYHCPLCPTYKATKLCKLKKHLDVHNKNSISFEDKKICRCHLECRNSGHFHCPFCQKTILKRSDMAKHLMACQKTFLMTSALVPETISTTVPITSSPQKTVSPLQVISPSPTDDHGTYSAISTVDPAALKDKHTLLKIKKAKCPHCSLVCYKKNIPLHIQRKHVKKNERLLMPRIISVVSEWTMAI
ncbi:uncharacterized protein LOC130927004 [Corythoichthys intestinalis]|uniref:uncharacterized protein LOC130927004 n=1 Tax=Corythoichthys intestinalis TaxID=161448 RepID=UPI0025A5734E|nr:uncharacterized protein LOC130927004 [Corythoichthys intestinalis]XP_057708436.1 uncharacterized protein LOC130927004 [Corythoichthys intestinalis]